MPTKVEKDAVTGTNTTGHEWDGIRELDTPMPSWWLYTFYATIVFAAVWVVLYPSVPFLRSHFGGVLGYSQRAEVRADIAQANARQATFRQRIALASAAEVRGSDELLGFAMIGGRAAFNVNCAQCHQIGGAGVKGYPNLADDDWLWGGSLEAIEHTVRYGVRNTDERSRQSQMPRFGADGILTAAQISDVADFVLSLSGQIPAATGQGKAIYAENCAVCHGDNGQGNTELGAPVLNDRIWLYGGRKTDVVEMIARARNGSMPAWGPRLDDATIKMLTVYVHELGGGQ